VNPCASPQLEAPVAVERRYQGCRADTPAEFVKATAPVEQGRARQYGPRIGIAQLREYRRQALACHDEKQSHTFLFPFSPAGPIMNLRMRGFGRRFVALGVPHRTWYPQAALV